MTRMVFFIICVMLALMGCQQTNSVPNVLDTSNLQKLKDDFPSSYLAPSLSVALKAIPFEFNLPKYYPFNNQVTFKNANIRDYGDKSKINIYMGSILKEQRNILFSISVMNYKFLETYHTEKIILSDGTVSYLDSGANSVRLFWNKDGKSYYLKLSYIKSDIPKDKISNLEEELVKVADSISEVP
jgi:hypothetical protein